MYLHSVVHLLINTRGDEYFIRLSATHLHSYLRQASQAKDTISFAFAHKSKMNAFLIQSLTLEIKLEVCMSILILLLLGFKNRP